MARRLVWIRVGGSATAAAVASQVAMAQSAPRQESIISRGAFVTTLGTDTVAVERFTRTATRLEGEIIRRTPSLVHSRYTVNVVDGRPASIQVIDRAGDGSLLSNRARSFVLTMARDSLIGELQLDTLVVQRRAGPDAVPWLQYSWALAELNFGALRAGGSDSTALMHAIATEDGIRQPRRVSMWIRERSGFQWNLLGAGPTIFSFDDRQRVTRVDATHTTTRFVVERLEHQPDVAAIARAYAAEETSGKRFGSLNTDRDTVRATVAGGRIVIDYGRPKRRGRRVFVDGVLGDTLWRTGANAATQIATDADLVIDGKSVPAGKYTLWTLVSRDNTSYTLIVNTQTGQWGVPQFNYRPERDLLRVPLRMRRLADAIDQFTIAVEPTEAGGVIRLLWDTTELSVPFSVSAK